MKTAVAVLISSVLLTSVLVGCASFKGTRLEDMTFSEFVLALAQHFEPYPKQDEEEACHVCPE